MGTLEAWIATYPGGDRFLGETVESLRAQGVEPVVLNDDRPNYEKWNQAIAECRSDYLALPHHDDIYLPGWSSEMVAYLDSHPEVVAVFCLDYLIDEDGKRVGQTYPAWDEQDTYSFKELFEYTARHGNVMRCETVVLNRRLLGDLRYPDHSLCGTAHDTQFWFTLAARHPIGIVMKPLVKYRVHSGSDTQKAVVGQGKYHEHSRAMLYAASLRPQDVEFTAWIGITKQLRNFEDMAEASRVKDLSVNPCELLVCHEPPENAGTGMVVAHRVRRLNRSEDGRIRYYVHPVKGSKDIEVLWGNGIPIVRCPDTAFGDVVERLAPRKIEYHHLLQWPLDIINAPCDEKELWLHDSYLWCARYHSVNKSGEVCNEPEDAKCAECSGEAPDRIRTKREFLLERIPKVGRVVANSEYTKKWALANLGVLAEVVEPEVEPLVAKPRRLRVGYFGGFGHVKGTPILLKAWKMANLDAQLLLFCDVPEDWKEGRALVGFDNVLVMGRYRRADLPELCNLVDLAVVPSVNESFGLVSRELSSLGVPVICTHTGGMEGNIPPGDAEALAVALRAAF